MIETLQDIDAEKVERWFNDLYKKIERHIQEGKTPEWIADSYLPGFGWPSGNAYREMCANAAKSIYRRHKELEAAKAALEKANDQ
jgi:hypothetical protein